MSFLPAEARSLLHRFAGVQTDAERLAKTIEEGQKLLETMLENRFAGIELLAEAWADYELARGQIEADDLVRKKHPAYSSAEVVKVKSKELAAMRKRAKYLEQLLKLYEWHVPWLTELRDIEEEESYAKLASVDGDQAEDPAAGWLTKEEWAALAPAERNQRALDRYWKAKKSKWQVGRDYERYVGYLYEQDGYDVAYYGIEQGLADLGRDVIATKDGQIDVVQCKRWSAERTIHEKHIFQLFGTVTAFRIDNPRPSPAASSPRPSSPIAPARSLNGSRSASTNSSLSTRATRASNATSRWLAARRSITCPSTRCTTPPWSTVIAASSTPAQSKKPKMLGTGARSDGMADTRERTHKREASCR